MTQELIPVKDNEVNGETVPTVNARELYEWLGIGRDFSTWIKGRIEKYNFMENNDFIFFTNSGEKLGRGRPSDEYYLTFDMAKELSMIENNEKGHQARKYFIACEKKLKQVDTESYIRVLKRLQRKGRDADWLLKLIKYRKVKGLTLKETAKLLDCGLTAVSKYE